MFCVVFCVVRFLVFLRRFVRRSPGSPRAPLPQNPPVLPGTPRNLETRFCDCLAFLRGSPGTPRNSPELPGTFRSSPELTGGFFVVLSDFERFRAKTHENAGKRRKTQENTGNHTKKEARRIFCRFERFCTILSENSPELPGTPRNLPRSQELPRTPRNLPPWGYAWEHKSH